jgi:hypothetical protein
MFDATARLIVELPIETTRHSAARECAEYRRPHPRLAWSRNVDEAGCNAERHTTSSEITTATNLAAFMGGHTQIAHSVDRGAGGPGDVFRYIQGDGIAQFVATDDLARWRFERLV